MSDYVYPSIYFSYFLFLLLAGGAVYFFVRSFRDGYWGRNAEEVKYHVFEDAQAEPPAPPVFVGQAVSPAQTE